MQSKNKTKVVAEAGKQEIFITREFEAPRKLVFMAFSDKKHLENWLGCKEMKVKYEALTRKHAAPDGISLQ